MPELTLDVAKEIAELGVKFNAWSWDNPDNVTDELVIETAQKLIDEASQASRNGSVNDAVLEILFAAKIEPLSESTKEAFAQRFPQIVGTNGHAAESDLGQTALDEMVDETVSELAAQAQAADGKLEIEGIFPGYDDYKVADIKKAILDSAASGDFSPDEWEQVKAYEAANEERKTILSLEPEFKAPEPEVPMTDVGHVHGEHIIAAVEEVAAESKPVMTGSIIDRGEVTFPQQGTPGVDSVKDFYESGGAGSIAQQENLPLPTPVELASNPPILPINITGEDDAVLSNLATQFHSCLVRTLWLQSQEEGRERAAEHLEREAERDAYVSAYELHKSEIPEEKRTQPTALEAARKAAERDAESAGPVRNYRSRKIRHAIDARELKALASGYDKAIFRIKDELERRNLGQRSSASTK